ncbi:hypothetical protein PTRA_b0680 [Pseudoalteromonas translucida KMM 520]|uniref:MetJ regulator of methionine regulon n=1 Tax=Pseudoalteromonas translucida KMM 520 TaxID=1315283 RepID=A0A0U2X524_9GAMM|nr:hypothetical protein [Pseudoalteromonas translucida]ALS35121.1 hypothetical protein PTRA_b0680 [Pseudoalteromonas translucida KMM 520]
MGSLKIGLLISASIIILIGYFRIITDEKGRINLNNYRLTGGVLLVCKGIYKGTCDLIAGEISKNTQSACIIYLGVILFIIGFSL